MIILDDVCFAYDDRPILSHLTKTIEPGQPSSSPVPTVPESRPSCGS